MQWGLMGANVGAFAEPDNAVALARAAESAGFDSLWTFEHVVVPHSFGSTYPYSASGKSPGLLNTAMPDPMVWLAYVAAATSTIKLGTGILILPQRNPVVMAKQAATLDVMSGGRLRLGVGVGWLREEFDALGVPFERRGHAPTTTSQQCGRCGLLAMCPSTASSRRSPRLARCRVP